MSQMLARTELGSSLQHIISSTFESPFESSSQGFYDGLSSISFLFFKLSTLYPDLKFEKQSLLSWANQYFHASTSPIPSPSRCGIASERLATTVLSVLLTPSTASKDVSTLSTYATALAQDPRPSSTEWLYGFSGLLYFLRVTYYYRRAHINDGDIQGNLSRIASATRAVISRIFLTPQPWLWHSTPYLGAAHGSIGTLTQITLSTVMVLPRAEHGAILIQVEQILHELLNQQFPSGNFPSSYRVSPNTPPSKHEDRLVQFCHGAPGVIVSLRSLRPHLPASTSLIDRAIDLGESCVRSRGGLDKEPCLCHGASGNALALADPEERLEVLKQKATQVVIREGVKTGSLRRSDHPMGLFGGEAGRAWAWAVVERDMEGVVLGYNDV